MKRPDLDDFLKKDLHAPLQEDELAHLDTLLANNPEAQNAWAEEVRLNRLLRQLPDAPVPSNFTSLVVRAVETEHLRSQSKASKPFSWWRGWNWATSGAVAAAVVLFAGMTVRSYQSSQRAQAAQELAQSFAAISDGAPFFDILTHFDEIRVLPASLPLVGTAQPTVDLELLATNP